MDALTADIREKYGRVVYAHKTHEKERERQSRLSVISKWINIGLGAITLGGLVAALTNTATWGLLLSVVVGTLNVGYMLAQLSFDPLRRAFLHRAAAKQLLAVRDGYQTLIADLEGGFVKPNDARDKRDELDLLAQEAYRLAPDTSNSAYKQARKGLKENEELTFSEAEIDALLPAAFKRSDESTNG